MTTTLPPADLDLPPVEVPHVTHARADPPGSEYGLPIYLDDEQAGVDKSTAATACVAVEAETADSDAARIKAEAEAHAIRIKAEAETERQRLANRRTTMRLEQDEAAHKVKMARLAADEAAADRAQAEELAASEAAQERALAEREEKEKAEQQWKYGALGIYIAGAVVSLPLQLLAFYDPDKPFLLMAPGFLEGLALVLSFGANYAVSHGKAVWPYRLGVMFAACIAATVNLVHGYSDPKIGIAAGAIGALTSLGGPIVWTAYEHGRAKRLDGVPTRRERVAAEKAAAAEERRRREEAEQADAEAKAKAEQKKDEELRRAQDKAAADKAAVEDQVRRDKERQAEHPEVWAVAVARRTAIGSAIVTEQIWAAAWEVIHGTKEVGVTADIRARLTAARTAMQDAGKGAENTASPQVESQTPPGGKDEEDRRKYNSGSPPLRRPGDSPKYLPNVGKVGSTQTVTRPAPRTARRRNR